MQRFLLVKGGMIAATAVLMLLIGVPAQAATRDMVGSVSVINPSVSAPNYFEVGPFLFGKNQGAYAVDAGFKTVMVTGASASTTVSRQVTLPADHLKFSGFQQRLFPTFANVGNGQTEIRIVWDFEHGLSVQAPDSVGMRSRLAHA